LIGILDCSGASAAHQQCRKRAKQHDARGRPASAGCDLTSRGASCAAMKRRCGPAAGRLDISVYSLRPEAEPSAKTSDGAGMVRACLEGHNVGEPDFF
jgi:hypothetical protein